MVIVDIYLVTYAYEHVVIIDNKVYSKGIFCTRLPGIRCIWLIPIRLTVLVLLICNREFISAWKKDVSFSLPRTFFSCSVSVGATTTFISAPFRLDRFLRS